MSVDQFLSAYINTDSSIDFPKWESKYYNSKNYSNIPKFYNTS